jgi:putative intracellular protease/amidase
MEFDKERFKTPNPLARVIVLTADKFEDFELFVPYFRMMEEGVAVDVAAPAKETLTLEDTQQRRDNVVSLASRR